MFQFTKYLAFKAVQVVVQSRLGDKCQAPSCPDTTKANISPWINFSVQNPDPHVFGPPGSGSFYHPSIIKQK
jgi:hypothetical protein